MKRRQRETLRAIVATLAPVDACIERIVAKTDEIFDELECGRRRRLAAALDLLSIPMLIKPFREASLRWMADAPCGIVRTAFAAVKRLSLFLAYAECERGAPNPTWSRLGYPGPHTDRGSNATPFVLTRAPDGATIEADAVVIGSGAGGGVAAASLARAGKRVVVLEAGGGPFAHDYTQLETSVFELYLERGFAASNDLGLLVLAGSTLGGGTAINCCTTLRLPERVAAEWERQSGIAGLGRRLEPHFTALERELAIAPLERHNANNAVIVDGCRALGLHSAAQPRNASGDCADGCGYCLFGCAYGNKRSTDRVYLPDVVARGGAIYAGAQATQIDFDRRRVCAVEAIQRSSGARHARLRIQTPLAVVAAGALRTPGLLARSGVRHPSLGRRLFVHPTAGCIAEFDRPIEPYRGAMQTAYSDAFNYRNGNYGAILEAAPTHPGVVAMSLPWRSRGEHARAMDAWRNSATLFALVRDRDPGRIDLDDRATIHYRLSRFDGENLVAGLAALFEVSFAAGALRVSSGHNVPIVIERENWNGAMRERLPALLRARGFAANRQTLFSSHQMGTAPLGTERRTSVADPAGRVWGYENLLVADASLFPQSSGVNPMLTIMALARHVAQANLT